MRRIENACVGCEECHSCGRRYDTVVFFDCDRCGDTVEMMSVKDADGDECDYMEDAPDGSGQYWCEDCVARWEEEEEERKRDEELERFNCSALFGFETLRSFMKDLDVFITITTKGLWFAHVTGTWKDGYHDVFTESYLDHRAMLEELDHIAGEWNKMVREKVTK